MTPDITEHFFTAQADFEFQDWYAHYGDHFYEAVDKAITQLRTHPHSAPIFIDEIRRLVLPSTPLGLFYGIHGSRIAIIAILDLRQDAKRIEYRLRKN